MDGMAACNWYGKNMQILRTNKCNDTRKARLRSQLFFCRIFLSDTAMGNFWEKTFYALIILFLLMFSSLVQENTVHAASEVCEAGTGVPPILSVCGDVEDADTGSLSVEASDAASV